LRALESLSPVLVPIYHGRAGTEHALSPEARRKLGRLVSI
jgi:hypothetical protein